MKISPARIAAFDVLKRIETERAFSAVLLPGYESELSQKDAGLCHELVLGVLRRQMYLDALIDKTGSTKKLDLAVRLSLRLGMYQLLFLDKVPAYSAINESVNLVHRAKKSSARGFTNAILRKIQRAAPALTFEDEADQLSVEHSHPLWLVERWFEEFGEAETRRLVAANNRTPQSALRLTRRGGSESYLVGPHVAASRFVEGGYIVEQIDRELLLAAARGSIYFQDEGSQIVGRAVGLAKGENFLDVCAAPGSKTTQIATGGDGFLVAGDIHMSRAEYLRENCFRQGIGYVNVAVYDAERPLPFSERSFDAVLVDAPCTGTGTIGHNPEIRYHLKPEDPSILSIKQKRILANAASAVRQGGRLIYSTCSLEREENEDVAEHFVASNREFVKRAPRVDAEFLTNEGFARTSPAKHGLDGFFIAAFERRSA